MATTSVIVILWPALIAAVGLVIYLATKPDNAKVTEIGRIMFAMGLLAVCLALTGTAFRL